MRRTTVGLVAILTIEALEFLLPPPTSADPAPQQPAYVTSARAACKPKWFKKYRRLPQEIRENLEKVQVTRIRGLDIDRDGAQDQVFLENRTRWLSHRRSGTCEQPRALATRRKNRFNTMTVILSSTGQKRVHAWLGGVPEHLDPGPRGVLVSGTYHDGSPWVEWIDYQKGSQPPGERSAPELEQRTRLTSIP